MKDLEARVHLPGGKTLDLGKDAKFEKKMSTAYGRAIVTIVMPEVQPGAIQDVIPTLRSEISCSIPKAWTECSSFTSGCAPLVRRRAQVRRDVIRENRSRMLR